jgi:hypothetical protein
LAAAGPLARRSPRLRLDSTISARFSPDAPASSLHYPLRDGEHVMADQTSVFLNALYCWMCFGLVVTASIEATRWHLSVIKERRK